MAISLAHNGQPMQESQVKSYARIPQVLEVPNLIQSQIQSYEWFNQDGLREVYQEISPILDYTGKKYELHFLEHYFRDAKYSPLECKEREITYCKPLYVKTRLVMKDTGEIKEQEIAEIEEFAAKRDTMLAEIQKVIVGQDKVVEEVLITLFSRGHCLLVGVPGLAKTLLISTLAQILDLDFNRIQFNRLLIFVLISLDFQLAHPAAFYFGNPFCVEKFLPFRFKRVEGNSHNSFNGFLCRAFSHFGEELTDAGMAFSFNHEIDG